MLETDKSSEAQEFCFRGYRLDLSSRCLIDPRGNPVILSSRALDTLQVLVKHRGQTLSKAFLVESVWPDACVDENNLNQAITGIRKALGDSKIKSRFIKTVTGRGYCFVAELDEPEQANTQTSAPEYSRDPLIDSPDDALLHGKTQHADPKHKFITQGMYGIALLLFLSVLGAGIFLYRDRSQPLITTDSESLTAAQSPEAQEIDTRTIIPNSIAVLPLSNLTPSANEGNDIFILGLHDELINQLSNVTTLSLVSRSSVLSPSLHNLSLPEVSKLLRVESVITGTVKFVDSHAKVTLHMLNPETGVIQWTSDFEVNTGSFKELINAQSEIAASVKEKIRSDLGLGQQVASTTLKKPTDSFEAYRFNVAAGQAAADMNFYKSWEFANKALALDPNYIDALINFSKANAFLAIIPMKGMTSKEHLQLALQSAQRLIELAPARYEGYLLKTAALANNGQWDTAMLEIQHLHTMGAPLWDMPMIVSVLMSLGEFQSTIEILEANLKVEPVNTYGRGFLMAAYEMAGKPKQASLEYATGEELNPVWWGDSVNVFIALGRGESIHNLDDLYKTPIEIKNMISKINEGHIQGLAAKLRSSLNDNTLPAAGFIFYSAIAATINEPELAIEFMNLATKDAPLNLLWFWLPVFHEARQLPAFKDLLEKTGVVAYWQQHGWPAICKPQNTSFVCN